MACLKCGKEAAEKCAFCPECLEVMAKHPVKPGTPINLHQRKAPVPEKKSTGKRKKTIAQRYRQLRSISYWLVIICLILLAAVGAMAYQLFH